MADCPFKIGDCVRFTPSKRTIGWYQDIERFGVKIGETLEIERIKDDKYLYFESDKGGWHWEDFTLEKAR